jgi:hypothetical protein
MLAAGSGQDDHSRGSEREDRGDGGCRGDAAGVIPRMSKAERNQEGRTMEEHSKPEQELSEEQLREISGGCGQCIKDLDKAKHNQRTANGMLRSVQAVAERGDIDAAYRSLNTAKGNIRRAQWFLNRVTARGHHLPPDGNLPDLNLSPPH